MLSTLPRSRRRIATGGAMISVLVLSGLGLTASGNSAAAALTGKVGETIGMDLQLPAMPRAPEAPAIAATPRAPEGPEAVDTPDAPEMPARPAGLHRHATTVSISDGSVTMTDGPVRARDGAPMSSTGVPLISARTCKAGRDGDDKAFVVQASDHGRKAMIICSDRIAGVAAAATAQAAAAVAHAAVEADLASTMAGTGNRVRLDAMNQALAGMRAARLTIVNERAMNADQRKTALVGIDEGIADMQRDLAEFD